MIWMVDYTHYKQKIDPRLEAHRLNYFKIKSYVRYNKIGQTAPVRTRVYASGLLRLATILSKNGIEVRYLHYDMLEDILAQGDSLPEIITFSCVCPTAPRCAELAERIKAISPDTKIYLGGVHVNVAPKLSADLWPVFDKLITGYEIDAAEQIAGCSLKDTEKYIDYSLLPLPLSEYAINTFTSVGCPFQCRYCVDGIAPHFCADDCGQLDDMMKLLPERTLVHFFDSVLGYSEKRLRQVCEAIKNTKHKFLLSCDMRADLLNPELLKLMEEAGFVEIRLGMESVDDGLLKENERTLSYDKFLKQLQMIRENSNLYVALYTITGLPGTTFEVQNKTLEACDRLLKLKLADEIKNTLYVPYPMEHIDYAEQGITIHCSDLSKYDRQSYPVYSTKEMSQEELWNIYLETSERINISWLESQGFSDFDEIPVFDGYYSEYIESNYLGKADNREGDGNE